ncbi:MAG: NAD-dependent epimerase/dehydratase family protein [Pseudopedobacter sp.]|nr:NAD-dependent epimerase/dehydratase family protein [Deinococcales bacterium]
MNTNQNNRSSTLKVIFGGRGGSGEALALELLRQGKSVRVVNRSGTANLPAGIEVVRGNLLEPQSLLEAVRGASTLYHSANVPYMQWEEVLPKMLEGFLAAGRSSGARLVYVDNLYMYGKNTVNMSEKMPEEPISRKGILRAKLGRRLLEAHRAGEVQATVARASDFYGPGVENSMLGTANFRGLLSGKALSWAGLLDAPHALTFISDLARALVLLGEHDEAPGKIWTIPTALALTGQQYLELSADIAGVKPKAFVITRPLLWMSGLFNPMHREFAEMLYQFQQLFTVDGSHFAQTFGFQPTPHREALKITLESLKQSASNVARAQTV